MTTDDRVRSVGVAMVSKCDLCGMEEESAIHLFISCTISHAVWSRLAAIMGFDILSERQGHRTLEEMAKLKLQRKQIKEKGRKNASNGYKRPSPTFTSGPNTYKDYRKESCVKLRDGKPLVEKWRKFQMTIYHSLPVDASALLTLFKPEDLAAYLAKARFGSLTGKSFLIPVMIILSSRLRKEQTALVGLFKLYYHRRKRCGGIL
ncbi:unnamed protein product [Ilex paraguariensis]|uniref:Reverse transcriptase zinc-binding domain-containing protein n=1 Tax=Ilex paraguariensis TaxID=185542 RepID=A0ABC8RFU9_9AQUA